MTENLILIEIPNWKKYQSRRDVKRCTWFRLEHDIFMDPKISELTASEFKIWVFLLTECSRQNSGVITVQIKFAHRVLNIDENEVHRAIEIFKQNYLVIPRTLRGRYADVTCTYRHTTVQYNTIQNNTVVAAATTQTENYEAAAGFESFRDLFKTRKVRKELQARWTEMFLDPSWICAEIKKALLWEEANPGRRGENNFSGFITRWLSRSWEDKQKAAAAVAPKTDWKNFFGDDYVADSTEGFRKPD